VKSGKENDIKVAAENYLAWFKVKFPQSKDATFNIGHDQLNHYFEDANAFESFCKSQGWTCYEPLDLFGYTVKMPIS